MGSRPANFLTVILVACAAVWLVAAAAPDVFRSGYRLDEELTVLAVRGIMRDGLPTLGSGALYERGLPYSYVATVAGRVVGRELPAYRLTSLVLGALAVVVMFAAGRAAGGTTRMAVTASWLIAVYPWMALSASWARFYSFATLTMAAGVAMFFSSGARRWSALFPAVVLIASLVHEAGILLLLFPVIAAVCRDNEPRQAARPTIVPAVLAVVAGRLLLLGLNFAVPNQLANPWIAQPAVSSSWFLIPGRQLVDVAGATALIAMACAQIAIAFVFARRGRSAVGLMLPTAALATFLHLGMIVWWGVVATLILRERVRIVMWHAAMSLLTAIALWWVVFSMRGIAPVDTDSWRSFLVLGFAFPTDAVRFLTTKMPLTVALLAIAGTLAVVAPPSRLSFAVRLVLCLLATVVVALSFLDIGLADRYLLLIVPGIALVLAAIPSLLESVVWRGATPSFAGATVQIVGAALVLVLAIFDWHVLTPPLSFLTPVDLPPAASAAEAPQQGEEVITNDDIASAFNLGRADYWYVESVRDLETYRLETPNGPKGLYSGAVILDTSDDLKRRVAACAQSNGCLFAVFRTGRFPFEGFERLTREMMQAFAGVEVRRSDAMTLVRIPRSHAAP